MKLFKSLFHSRSMNSLRRRAAKSIFFLLFFCFTAAPAQAQFGSLGKAVKKGFNNVRKTLKKAEKDVRRESGKAIHNVVRETGARRGASYG